MVSKMNFIKTMGNSAHEHGYVKTHGILSNVKEVRNSI